MSTRTQLELRAQIAILRRMRLNPPFEALISNLTAFYARKIELYQRLSEISGAIIGCGPSLRDEHAVTTAPLSCGDPLMTTARQKIKPKVETLAVLVFPS
jgi:hypothetical protein